jgi:TolB-like protein/Flp pilus assembly protein TadD
MAGESPRSPSAPTGAVFLSYASQDAEAAKRICDALRAAGIEVWFDQSELRGGDAWDQKIRQEIHDCALFIPIVSQHSQERLEGYFRHEWKLATERAHHMAEEKAFLVPVVVDATRDQDAIVPDTFRAVQWTRLPGGATSPTFVARIAALLGAEGHAGHLTTVESPRASSRPGPRLRRAAPWAWIGIALVAVAVWGGWLAWRHSGPHAPAAVGRSSEAPTAIPEKSIAVLPFVDMSEKHDQEYFADGMTEEIIDLLVKIPQLQVIGRTSSFQFRGKSEDVRSIGASLGAAYVLEGSLRRSGDRVRVTAQLVDAKSGGHRWSESYDRDVSDVLKVQSDIATSVARALQLTIVPPELDSPSSVRNGAAYDMHLRCLRAADRADEAGFEEAAAYCRRALELDPSFAPSAVLLGAVLAGQAEWGFIPAAAGFEHGRAMANLAIRLDPKSAVAHATLGHIHTVYDWDWSAAERELESAQRLAPNASFVANQLGLLRMALGDWGGARRYINASIATELLQPWAYNQAGWIDVRSGRFAEAEASHRQVLKIAPTYVSGHYYLGVVLLLEGKNDEALAEMLKESPVGGQAAGLAVVYVALHRTREADAALKRLITENAGDAAMGIAEAYAYRGQTDEAFQWLDRAYAQKDIELYYVKGDPLLKNLEGDPRYKVFLRKMNLPES